MNAADRSAQTYHLIDLQRRLEVARDEVEMNLEAGVAGAKKALELAHTDLKPRKGKKAGAGSVPLYEQKLDEAQAKLAAHRADRLQKLAAVGHAIRGTGPVADWMLVA